MKLRMQIDVCDMFMFIKGAFAGFAVNIISYEL